MSNAWDNLAEHYGKGLEKSHGNKLEIRRHEEPVFELNGTQLMRPANLPPHMEEAALTNLIHELHKGEHNSGARDEVMDMFRDISTAHKVVDKYPAGANLYRKHNERLEQRGPTKELNPVDKVLLEINQQGMPEKVTNNNPRWTSDSETMKWVGENQKLVDEITELSKDYDENVDKLNDLKNELTKRLLYNPPKIEQPPQPGGEGQPGEEGEKQEGEGQPGEGQPGDGEPGEGEGEGEGQGDGEPGEGEGEGEGQGDGQGEGSGQGSGSGASEMSYEDLKKAIEKLQKESSAKETKRYAKRQQQCKAHSKAEDADYKADNTSDKTKRMERREAARAAKAEAKEHSDAYKKLDEEYRKLRDELSKLQDEDYDRKNAISQSGIGSESVGFKTLSPEELKYEAPEVDHNHTETLKRSLIQYLTDKINSEDGGINPAKLPTYYNTDDLYSSDEFIKPKKTRIFIFADSSGSVEEHFNYGQDSYGEGGKLSKARAIEEAILVAGEAVQQIQNSYGCEIELEIQAFQTDCYMIKKRDEKFDAEHVSNEYRGYIGGGTQLGKAIKLVNGMPEETNTRDVIILMSDGQINGSDRDKLIRNVAGDKLWVLLGVGVRTGCAGAELFNYNAQSKKEVAEVMVKAVTETLG